MQGQSWLLDLTIPMQGVLQVLCNHPSLVVDQAQVACMDFVVKHCGPGTAK